MAAKAVKVGGALAKWVAAGSPVRSQEEIDRLFAICSGCEHFKAKDDNDGACNICGCAVRKYGIRNKLLWATESCPAGKWTAEV